LATLWLWILLAAHPWGPFKPVGDRLWAGLAQLGLDVSITPLTADMTLMREWKDGSYYQRQAQFWIRSQANGAVQWVESSWDPLDFHGVRIPLLLMLELVREGVPASGHVRGICTQLKRRWEGAEAFRVELVPAHPEDSRLGLSTVWECPK